jgi:hypothetical protein
LKDKGRQDYTLNSATHGPPNGVQFTFSINPGGVTGIGQTGAEDEIILYNTVQARNGGVATAGNIAIGNVTGPVGLSGELSFLEQTPINLYHTRRLRSNLHIRRV